MARRRRKSRGTRPGLQVDFTELKMAAILGKKWNVPQAADRLVNKDLGGAFNAFGEGTILGVGVDSVSAGFIGKLRRSAGMYLQPVKTRRMKFKI